MPDHHDVSPENRAYDDYHKPQSGEIQVYNALLDYKGKQWTQYELCHVYNIPNATLGRWLKRLTEHGYVEKTPVPQGGRRRILCEVSEAGYEFIETRQFRAENEEKG